MFSRIYKYILQACVTLALLLCPLLDTTEPLASAPGQPRNISHPFLLLLFTFAYDTSVNGHRPAA